MMEVRILAYPQETQEFVSNFKNDFKMMNDVSKPALAGLWPTKGMNVVFRRKYRMNKKTLDFAELGLLYTSLYPYDQPFVLY